MESTKSTEVKLYLASSDIVVRVNKPLKVGRYKGDVILEDDEELSALHCELIPRVMSLWIKDLGSHNGVYVNKTKILPDTETKLNAGDEVVIGGQTFVFLDSEQELLAKFPKPDRRKSSRPKSLFAPIHLVNFHYAPMNWKALYVLGILLTAYSMIGNAHLKNPLPDDLQFLGKIYHEQILVSGIKAVSLVWLISVAHSFLLAHYFNRNIARRVFAVGLYGVLLFFSVDIKNGPLSPIKTYAESREAILKEELGDKSILRLRNLVDHEDRLKSSYPLIVSSLEGDQRKAVEKDYAKIAKTIEGHKAKVSKR